MNLLIGPPKNLKSLNICFLIVNFIMQRRWFQVKQTGLRFFLGFHFPVLFSRIIDIKSPDKYVSFYFYLS